MQIEGQDVGPGQCVVSSPKIFPGRFQTGCKLTQLEMSLEMKKQDEEFFKREEKFCPLIIKNCDEIVPLIEGRIARLFREETEHNEFLLKITAVEMMITLNYYINQKAAAMGTAGQATAWIQEHFDEPVNLEKCRKRRD